MRRRLLIALAVLLVIVLGGSFVIRRMAVVRAEKALTEPWPLGAGPITAVASRYPNQEMSPSARRLTQLAQYFRIPLAPKRQGDPAIAPPLKRDLEPYVRAQIARASFAIDPPPPLLASMFATPQFAAIRAELLRGEPIVWPVRYEPSGPVPNLTGHLALQRLLIASALDRARRGDPGAWEDLRASRELNRSLWPRPEVITHLIALQTTRIAVAAARKLPPPAPPWFEEMLREEMPPRFVRSFQAEIGMSQTRFAADVGKGLREPLVRSGSMNALVLARGIAEDVTSPVCAVEAASLDERAAGRLLPWEQISAISLPSLGATWQRMARYRAEREATRIALAVRAGLPPPLRSDCSDRKWIVDGGVVRLNAPLPKQARDVEIPLEVPLHAAAEE
ncbi:MAG TPA: hypothetical protein VGF48_12585 [Thermoanaerobaculia bacterium]|jgi:hypothetical protein